MLSRWRFTCGSLSGVNQEADLLFFGLSLQAIIILLNVEMESTRMLLVLLMVTISYHISLCFLTLNNMNIHITNMEVLNKLPMK